MYTRTLRASGLLSLAAASAAVTVTPTTAVADMSDPGCAPTTSVIGWSVPKNVAIQDPASLRLPLDATIRVGFSGPWCPDEATVSLIEKKTMEPVPAQVRIVVPQALFHNEPSPLSIIELDPIDQLKVSTDYIVNVRPAMPALQIYADYEIQFRAGRRVMAPWPEFEGIKEVLPARDQADCWGDKIFAFSDADMMRNSVCMRERRLELKVVYQPLDRPEATYAIYRTRSIPLDEGGLPKPDDPTYDDQLTLIGYEAGVSDQGSGVREKSSPYNVPYHVLPRRECFAVLLVDEWGREIGDRADDACIDIPVLTPCPQPNGMEQNYPEPNPFEIRTPVDGPACDEVCLNGADCESHIPPERPDPPTGGMSGEGGSGGENGGGGSGGESGGGGTDESDGGITDADAGAGGSGAGGGAGADDGGGGGCQVRPGAMPSNGGLFALLASGLLGLFTRRRRHAR